MKLSWLSGLFFCMALLAYLLLDEEETPLTQAKDWDGYTPDYVASNLYSRNFDEDGNLASTVFAKTMESYPELNLTIFYRPEVTLYTDQSQQTPSWHVKASEGSLYQEKEQLQLRGGVTITANDSNSQLQTMTTPALVLEIKSNQMHTDDQVKAVGPHLSMTGIGLHADLNQQNVEILQHVEAQYDHHPAN